MYELISGSGIILPALMVLYIVSCHRRHDAERIEDFAAYVLIVECVIFSSIYVYLQVIAADNEDCEDTGTILGALLMVPLYIAGASCSLFGLVILAGYLFFCTKDVLRRVCCCCGGTVLMGSSLAKLKYSSA